MVIIFEMVVVQHWGEGSNAMWMKIIIIL